MKQLLLALLLSGLTVRAQVPAAPPVNTEIPFPLGETLEGGFGTQTRGGLDGKVLKVTNLNDEGPGSLRAAVEAKEPRVVVFEVSGQINLTRNLNIRNPFVTVAGQTAPSPGITLANATLRITTHDVVVQHLRCRPGNLPGKVDLEDRDGIQLVGIQTLPPGEERKDTIYNVVLDHCSVSWSCDEGISTYFPGIRDVTIRHCIIAEALDKAGHPKGGHSMGLLIGQHTHNVSILGNLFAHNRYRNPVLKADTNAIIANNVMYDIGNNCFHSYGGEGGSTLATAVANVLLEGPTRARETKGKSTAVDFYLDKSTKEGGTNPGSQIYLARNLFPASRVEGRRVLEHDVFATKPPVTLENVRLLPPEKVVDYVLSRVGARPKDRDPVDVRLVKEVRERGGRIIDTQADVGGWPALAENHVILTRPADGKLEAWLESFRQKVE